MSRHYTLNIPQPGGLEKAPLTEDRVSWCIADALQHRATICLRIHANHLIHYILERENAFPTTPSLTEHHFEPTTHPHLGLSLPEPTVGFLTDAAGTDLPQLLWNSNYGDTIVKLKPGIQQRLTISLGCARYEGAQPFSLDDCYESVQRELRHLDPTSFEYYDFQHRLNAFMHSDSVDDLASHASGGLSGLSVLQVHLWETVEADDIEAIFVRDVNELPQKIYGALWKCGRTHIPVLHVRQTKKSRSGWDACAKKVLGRRRPQRRTGKHHPVNYYPVEWCGAEYLAICGATIDESDPERFRRLFLPHRNGTNKQLHSTHILVEQAKLWTPMAVGAKGHRQTITLGALLEQYGPIGPVFPATSTPHENTFTWQQSLGLSDKEARAITHASCPVLTHDRNRLQALALRNSKRLADRRISEYYLRKVGPPPPSSEDPIPPAPENKDH